VFSLPLGVLFEEAWKGALGNSLECRTVATYEAALFVTDGASAGRDELIRRPQAQSAPINEVPLTCEDPSTPRGHTYLNRIRCGRCPSHWQPESI
jgi:hypothetical protein